MDDRHDTDELYKAGLTTEQALKILHEDIENVVLREELKFSNERFVFSTCLTLKSESGNAFYVYQIFYILMF